MHTFVLLLCAVSSSAALSTTTLLRRQAGGDAPSPKPDPHTRPAGALPMQQPNSPRPGADVRTFNPFPSRSPSSSSAGSVQESEPETRAPSGTSRTSQKQGSQTVPRQEKSSLPGGLGGQVQRDHPGPLGQAALKTVSVFSRLISLVVPAGSLILSTVQISDAWSAQHDEARKKRQGLESQAFADTKPVAELYRHPVRGLTPERRMQQLVGHRTDHSPQTKNDAFYQHLTRVALPAIGHRELSRNAATAADGPERKAWGRVMALHRSMHTPAPRSAPPRRRNAALAGFREVPRYVERSFSAPAAPDRHVWDQRAYERAARSSGAQTRHATAEHKEQMTAMLHFLEGGRASLFSGPEKPPPTLEERNRRRHAFRHGVNALHTHLELALVGQHLPTEMGKVAQLERFHKQILNPAARPPRSAQSAMWRLRRAKSTAEPKRKRK